MREDASKWFSKWEEELPKPDDLIPLSHTLITPQLSIAFNIETSPNPRHQPHHHPPPIPTQLNFIDLDPSDLTETTKRPRLVWTPQLHKQFVAAVNYIGVKNAIPKTIMQVMSVEGLTRENIASHLQKYRNYLNKQQGFSSGNGAGDPATDRLFAGSPVPPHLLNQSLPNSVTGQQIHRQPNGMESVKGKKAPTLFPTGDD